MSQEYQIKQIMKLKFTDDDIYILVQWKDTCYRIKPKVDALGRVKRYKRNQWKVHWKPSWIKITSLTATSSLWSNFYKNTILPTIKNVYEVDTEIVID